MNTLSSPDPSLALPGLERRLSALSIGAVVERLDIESKLAAVYHALEDNESRDLHIDYAKEAAFGLLSLPSIKPAYVLLAWGIAAAADSNALFFRLRRFNVSAMRGQWKMHTSDAVTSNRFAPLLFDLHLMLCALYEKQSIAQIESEFLSALHADRHERAAGAWALSLHALIVAVRDRRLDVAVEERGTRLDEIRRHHPLDPAAMLDFYGLGILGVAKRLGVQWTASPTPLPKDLAFRGTIDRRKNKPDRRAAASA